MRRLPFQTLADSCVPDWIEAIKEVEAMDVDILPPGHGPLGTRADATDHRRYVEDLHHAVLEAARAGQSLEEMQAGVTRDRYRDWDQYQGWLPMNLEGRYTR